ncbi:MAG: preprotein translocase subunit YajC [Alphaproteobacteria bacterium]|nr:preprotein translocase subunit YajC [Alphaproteobacteria bacterium]
MLISKAYAQSVEIVGDVAADAPQAPDAVAAFAWNMGLVLVLVVLFYVLLIAPQQRRFKEHGKMLAELKKGDKVVTGGGLVGVIDKMVGDDEVVVDLGNGTKVTAMLSTLQGKNAPLKPANDEKAAKDKKPSKPSKKKSV